MLLIVGVSCFELRFIFVFSSLIMDNDESSVRVERNAVLVLSDVDERFQSSFDSKQRIILN